MATNLQSLTINNVAFTAFDQYTPDHIDMTKGGRNNLTGINNMRLQRKCWKLVVTAKYISDEDYAALINSISDTLNVSFTFMDTESVTCTGYVVITKSRTPESDAMGCWCDFNMELIEN